MAVCSYYSTTSCDLLPPMLRLDAYRFSHAHTAYAVCLCAALQVGTLHQRTQSMQHKMGPVTCMAWHPYNLYLGAAGTDSVASVYIVDNVSSSNANSGVSYAPTSVSSVSGLGVGSVGGPALQSAASMLSASSMASSATLGV